jgi:hypothetical protein
MTRRLRVRATTFVTAGALLLGGAPAATAEAPRTEVASVRAATDPPGTPFGALDGVQGSTGQVRVTGWAFDPDGSVIVQLYVDGVYQAMGLTSVARPDVPVVHPEVGPTSGYQLDAAAAPGRHRVCVYAANVGPGASTTLGCRDDVVPSSDPFGQVDSMTASWDGFVTASGWAVDPDEQTTPLIVQLYVDGQFVAMAQAAQNRPDLAVLGAAGTQHGYTLTGSIAGGTHTACVYAVNVGPGSSTQLGCRIVSVTGRDPIGHIDSVRVSGTTVVVTGWAMDMDEPGPVIVQAYVDGRYGGMARSDILRTEPSPFFRAWGPYRGFELRPTAGPGTRTVCIYAVNVGPGSSTQLGCVRVQV